MSIPHPKKRRFYQKWWFWFVAVVVLIIIGAIVWAAIADSTNKFAQYDNLRESVAVERRDLSKLITTTGTIAADESAVMPYNASGTVVEVNYVVGDEVVKGDDLVAVDTALGGNQILEAPFDGRILSVQAFEGAPATAGMPAVTVGYRSSHAQFLASEAEVIDLKVGQPATITIPSHNNGRDEYTGEVTFVDIQKQSIATSSGSSDSGYMVHVSLGDVPSELQDVIGLTIDMEIEVGSRTDVLSLETGAVHTDDQDETFVYVLPTIDDAFAARAESVEDVREVLDKKYVEVGFRGDEYVEITDGLREGDTVLLYIPASTGGFPF